MCGRYSLINPDGAIHDQLGVDIVSDLVPRYNVAPAQEAPVVRMDAGRRILESRTWGLLAPRAGARPNRSRLINARAETVAFKPAFHQAYRRRRCVVPADGFYEWQNRGRNLPRQAFHIHRPDREPFVFAGLWEGDGTAAAFAIVTTEAPESLGHIHQRVPVILAGASIARWLETPEAGAGGLADILRPLPDGELVADAVAPFVNNARNDTPECLTPADATRDLFD